MSPIFKIEYAIKSVCEEIYSMKSSKDWRSLDESDLFYELIACILGSRVSYELSQAAAMKIRGLCLHFNPIKKYTQLSYQKNIEKILKSKLVEKNGKLRLYPFPNLRADHISRTAWSIYSKGGSIKQILNYSRDAEKARLLIVKSAIGVGPKQASLFLRNIGLTTRLAILDSHVLKFMVMKGLVKKRIKTIQTVKQYEKNETILRKYAQWLGRPLGCLDQAIWIVMRVYLKEALA